MKWIAALLVLICSASSARASGRVETARTDEALPALLDWEALSTLNEQALSVWGEMLDCAQGRADLVHTAYLNRKWECPRDAAQKLRNRVRGFHASVRQFLESSFVAESDHQEAVPYLMLKFKQSEAVHPLLVQSLYESLSLVVKFNFLDKEVGAGKIWKIDAKTEAFIHKHWLVLRFAEPGHCENWGFSPLLAQSLDSGWFASSSRYIVPLEAYRNGSEPWISASWNLVSLKLRRACGALRNQNFLAHLKWWPQVDQLRKIAQAHRKGSAPFRQKGADPF